MPFEGTLESYADPNKEPELSERSAQDIQEEIETLEALKQEMETATIDTNRPPYDRNIAFPGDIEGVEGLLQRLYTERDIRSTKRDAHDDEETHDLAA